MQRFGKSSILGKIQTLINIRVFCSKKEISRLKFSYIILFSDKLHFLIKMESSFEDVPPETYYSLCRQIANKPGGKNLAIISVPKKADHLVRAISITLSFFNL